MARKKVDELADLDTVEKSVTSPIVAEIEARAKIALDKVQNWNKEAKEDFRFALGDQWTQEERDKLEEEGRPSLTFNKIESLIDLVSGYQRENSARIKVNPEGGEDRLFSEISDRCLKAIDKWSKLEYKLDILFDQGIICGKDWLEMAISYDEDPINGDLKFRNIGPYAVLKDPDSIEYDLSDCEYLIKISKVTKEKLKSLYPKQEDIITGFKIDTDDIFANLSIYKEGDDDNYHLGKEEIDTELGPVGIDVERKGKHQQFTLKEYWHKKYIKKWFIYNLKADVIEEFEKEDEAKNRKNEILAEYNNEYAQAMEGQQVVSQLGEMAGMAPPPPPEYQVPEIEIYERKVQEMHFAAACCGFEMQEDTKSPFLPSFNGFPLFQFISKFTPSAPNEKLRTRGITRNLKDPNREINKSRSQFLHILNTSANSGWIGDSNALTQKQRADLKKMGSKPGITIWKRPGSFLEKIEPSGVNIAQLSRGEKAEQDIKDISGINTDALAIQDKTTSGKAIALRIRQAVTILSKMFRNYRYTKEMVGTAVFNMIPNIFDAKKLRKTLGEQFMQEQGIDNGYLKAYLTQIKDGRFDIAVSEADNSATVRQETFEDLMQLAESGAPVPPDLIIEYSNIPDAKVIVERMQAYQQQVAAQAQAKPVK